MKKDDLQSASLVKACELILPQIRPGWNIDTLAGRFVEVLGTSRLTMSAELILQVQQRSELVAWIGATDSLFFPPDFAASGIDLAALPIIRIKNTIQRVRATDTIIRSGGFAAVILDIDSMAHLSFSIQTRLAGLAKKHNTLLVVLNRDPLNSCSSSLASLRVHATQKRIGHNAFICEVFAVKDKRHAPGWNYVGFYHGPDGMC